MALRGLFRVIKGGFKTTFDFEKSMSMVKAITGATGQDFEALRQSAIDLGGSTAFTASEVSSLQKEYAKLGFTNKEILKVTQGTLDLAAATGEDLATSAAVAGATLRGFGLDAGQMQRVVDVMAKSFTSSALDLSKFQTAMQNVAPVANATGDSIEEATAKLAVLADAGLDASTSGTSLRNIYLELEKRGMSWDEAMTQIRDSQNKASTSLQLFGKRGAVAGLILADNTAKAREMTGVFQDAEGAAQEMADINLENVAGQITKLKSAWEGLILRTNESTGALKGFLEGLTDIVASINSDGKPALDSLFETEKINGFMDRFKAFSDLGNGFFKSFAAARQSSDKEVEAIIDKGREAYDEMQVLEQMRLEDEQAIAAKRRAIQDKENADRTALVAAALEEQEKQKELQDKRVASATAYREKISQEEQKKLAEIGQDAYKDVIITGQQDLTDTELMMVRKSEEDKQAI